MNQSSPISQRSWFTIAKKPSDCFSTLLRYLCERVQRVYVCVCEWLIQCCMPEQIRREANHGWEKKTKRKKNLISINPTAWLQDECFLRVTSCRFTWFAVRLTQACTSQRHTVLLWPQQNKENPRPAVRYLQRRFCDCMPSTPDALTICWSPIWTTRKINCDSFATRKPL